jgi:hypothetical protein
VGEAEGLETGPLLGPFGADGAGAGHQPAFRGAEKIPRPAVRARLERTVRIVRMAVSWFLCRAVLGATTQISAPRANPELLLARHYQTGRGVFFDISCFIIMIYGVYKIGTA